MLNRYHLFLYSNTYFFGLRWRFPSLPEILQYLYYTMILQRPRIIVGDAGFEPGTSAPEVWRTASEPPHLHEPTHLFILALCLRNIFILSR